MMWSRGPALAAREAKVSLAWNDISGPRRWMKMEHCSYTVLSFDCSWSFHTLQHLLLRVTTVVYLGGHLHHRPRSLECQSLEQLWPRPKGWIGHASTTKGDICVYAYIYIYTRAFQQVTTCDFKFTKASRGDLLEGAGTYLYIHNHIYILSSQKEGDWA